MEPDLTLEKAKKVMRQREAVNNKQPTWTIEEVKTHYTPKNKRFTRAKHKHVNDVEKVPIHFNAV